MGDRRRTLLTLCEVLDVVVKAGLLELCSEQLGYSER